MSIQQLTQLVEELRQSKTLSNEQANLIEAAARLSPDDQVLANRLISRGSDPFSIQYLATGKVSDHVRQAHFVGPGLLEGEDRNDWLFLASLSIDEHSTSLPLREQVQQLTMAVDCYHNVSAEDRIKAIARTKYEIDELPYEMSQVGGREMRLYEADLGFAAAYWSGELVAAVCQDNGLTFVGTKPSTSLEKQGVTVGKQLTKQFGIVFPGIPS